MEHYYDTLYNSAIKNSKKEGLKNNGKMDKRKS